MGDINEHSEDPDNKQSIRSRIRHDHRVHSCRQLEETRESLIPLKHKTLETHSMPYAQAVLHDQQGCCESFVFPALTKVTFNPRKSSRK